MTSSHWTRIDTTETSVLCSCSCGWVYAAGRPDPGRQEAAVEAGNRHRAEIARRLLGYDVRPGVA